MWRLCSKIYFIGNSFWKFNEVRSERGDFNSCGKWSFYVVVVVGVVSLLLFRLPMAILLWLALVIFVSVSLARENLRGLWENPKHKIRTLLLDETAAGAAWAERARIMLGLMSMMDLLETEENISEIVNKISKYISKVYIHNWFS